MVNSDLERIWVEMVATKSRHLCNVSNNLFTNINGGIKHTNVTFNIQYQINKGDRGSTVVKVLCYKSEGRRFDPAGVIGIFH